MSENTNRTPRNSNQRKMYDYETDSYILVRSSKQPSLESRPKPQPKQQSRTSSRPQTQSSLQPQRRVTTGQHSGQQSRQQPMQPRPRTTTSSKLNGFKPPVVNGTRKSHNGEPFNKSNTPFAKTRHNKPTKPPKKRGLAVGALLCAGLITLSVAIAPLFSQDTTALTDPNKPSVSVDATHDYGDKNQTRPQQNKITSLDQINPDFQFITWKGEKHLTIDEESFKQIVELAMNDVRDFYYDDLKAPNISFTYDKSKNDIVNTTGKENFYEDGYGYERIAGMAQQESSHDLMVDFVNDIGRGSDNPSGILQIMPETTRDTLTEYFKNIFGEEIDLSDYEPLPTKEEVNAILSSNENDKKRAKEEIKDAVYDSVYLTVMSEVYYTKSMTKGHKTCYSTYYENYTPESLIKQFNIDPSQHDEVYQIFEELQATNGVYSKTLAHSALTAMHLNGFDNVRASLKNGSFFKRYFNSTYVKNILNNEDQIQANGFGRQPQ